MGYPLQYSWASLVAQLIKNLPAMWETWVRSLGERKGYPLQYSGVGNSMDWIGQGVTKSRIQLSDFHFSLEGYGFIMTWRVQLELSPQNSSIWSARMTTWKDTQPPCPWVWTQGPSGLTLGSLLRDKVAVMCGNPITSNITWPQVHTLESRWSSRGRCGGRERWRCWLDVG